jgi:uncharacterized protein (UPF0276 family)
LSRAVEGVGLGWRRELAADLLARRGVVDFVEIVAETCFVQTRMRREARAIAEIWPVVPHGVKLSLGSADGIDEAHARRLGALAAELRAPFVSEHVSFTRGGASEIGHLTALPRTFTAVRALARNVARARRLLPDVPLLLENVAATIDWPAPEMSEGRFHGEVVRATGCDLLLDLGNLYANAVNAGHDPLEVLSSYPLDRVAMVHLAGGHLEDGYYYDTHAAEVGAPVLELLAALVAMRGPVPVLVERDAEFPAFEATSAEIHRVRTLVRDCARSPTSRAALNPTDAARAIADDPHADRALAAAQSELARALTAVDEPSASACATFGTEALRRTREILKRKRVDDALPLLPRTAAHGDAVRSLALEAVVREPRALRGAGIADACRIADAVAREPAFAAAAAVDRLVLRARFVGPDRGGLVRARRGPFVGRIPLGPDRACWAIKGPGPTATVHLLERQGRKTR